MSDMLQTIVPKSDQLNADDLIGDRKLTITITKVKLSPGEQQSASISFEGDNGKPWKPCLSMRRVLVALWGKDSANYIGRKVTLYCDSKVVFGGKEVGGIRISHMSHLDAPRTLALTASKANRKPFTVLPLVENVVDPSVKAAGDDAAGQGVVAYRMWLETLEPSVKQTVRGFHKEWSATAKAYDEAIVNSEEVQP
jgi:hypothetical protein